ncbi:hypothetical protein FNV43_RR17042 [Rhamnella rubrinervis]|uniref:Uncharacterized protein n=1 Tax=Rhamnella rubrinervis TaxID=2594499 RepID=A0A8K0ME99_9ROSA|nr:hypothetical protein FNV43_RR17042 [Rhamnella rubrinervis]
MTFSLRVTGTPGHYYAYKYKKFNKAVEGLSSPKSCAKRLRPKHPRTLLAKSNKILRLEVQYRMKKSVLSPEHMTAYGLRVDLEAEEEERFSRPSPTDSVPHRSLRSKVPSSPFPSVGKAIPAPEREQVTIGKGKGVAVSSANKKRARSSASPVPDIPDDLLTFIKKARTFLSSELSEEIRREGMTG